MYFNDIEMEKISDEFSVMARRSLTVAEIEKIANEMMKFEKSNEQTFVRDIMLCEIVTDLSEDFDYNANYEKMVNCGFFNCLNNHIYNFEEIDNFVKHENDLGHVLNKFFDKISAYIEEVSKNIPDAKDNKKLIELVKLYGQYKK